MISAAIFSTNSTGNVTLIEMFPILHISLLFLVLVY